jgi:hypothetical protein
VKELIFRGKDRYRPSWSVLSGVGLVLILQLVIGYPRLGAVGVCWLVGLSAAALVLSIGAAVRSWTTVGPAGIAICWGIGRRGHTYRWQEIRWIDVRQGTGASSEARAIRITLANGRRRTLPAVRHTSAYPQPTFHADFRRVVEWWERRTDPAARFQPPKTLRSRLGPVMPGVIIALLIAVGVGLVMGIPGWSNGLGRGH